eukprot:scaffold15_cov234-Pinguiococcus_pyrenoidosus.AAC.3
MLVRRRRCAARTEGACATVCSARVKHLWALVALRQCESSGANAGSLSSALTRERATRRFASGDWRRSRERANLGFRKHVAS